MALVEVVVLTAPQLGLSAHAASPRDQQMSNLGGLLLNHSVVLEPVFSAALLNRVAAATVGAPGAGGYALAAPRAERTFHVMMDETKAAQFVADMRASPDVERVYIKPPASNPVRMQDMEAAPLAPTAAVLEDYSRYQGYLDSAKKGGVDARAAWAHTGGKGADVSIIDIEGGWCLTHRDLVGAGPKLLAGSDHLTPYWRNHGTAVLGQISGQHEGGLGVMGIAPEAKINVISHGGGLGTAGAIGRAAEHLREGDIILLEVHRAGPRWHETNPDPDFGYIAIEWWFDDWDAIRMATDLGIIVVEAAGNGTQNLDDAIYEHADWVNPFWRQAGYDSGAIIVGAGAPPRWTSQATRSRLDFSNWGDAVDCQGWGRLVTTAGYGHLHRGAGEHEFYTDVFSGTSSASPIIVGVLACLQGIAKARGGLLTPAHARDLLRSYGQPQPEPADERIGSLPNIEELLAYI